MTAKKTPPKTSKTAKPAAPAKSAPAKPAAAKVAGAKPAAATTAPAGDAKVKPAAKITDKSPPSNGSERKEVVATYVQRNPRPIAPPPDAEEGEDGNLLSGPRNVQPYISKRGEQYMSREQLEHFRTILQSWKTDLMREVDRTVSHICLLYTSPSPRDLSTSRMPSSA